MAEFLKTVPVNHVCPKINKIITLNKNDTVYRALHQLSENDILGAPVYDPMDKIFIGMIDMIDILAYIIDIFSETEALGETYIRLMESTDQIAMQTVEGICDYSRTDPWFSIPHDESMMEAAQLMCDKKLHRIMVTNAFGDPVSLLSQSYVVGYLFSHRRMLPNEFFSKPISQIDIGTSPVITVTASTNTIDAFKLMRTHGISGIAVVDPEDGHIIGNLSARDLKWVALITLSRLLMPVGNFLKHIKQSIIQTTNPVIRCRETDTMEHIIGVMIASRIHRIYICNGLGRPVRVISLTDIIQYFVY